MFGTNMTSIFLCVRPVPTPWMVGRKGALAENRRACLVRPYQRYRTGAAFGEPRGDVALDLFQAEWYLSGKLEGVPMSRLSVDVSAQGREAPSCHRF